MLDQRIVDTVTELLAAARASNDPGPTAMILASSDGQGQVSARVVLLKGIDRRGLRFYTNHDSRKGQQLAAQPNVALCLHWKTLGTDGGTQVRVEGVVERLPAAESDAYFASRERGSQIGAWASLQSQVLLDRATFEARVAHYQRKFADRPVPRPAHWGGFVVAPVMVEFWHGAPHRLHERVCWQRDADDVWTSRLLYP